MPREARHTSMSGFYHIMVRGNGKQILFENDESREFYLSKLYFCFKDENVLILAWCLMDNHAHLLVLDEDGNLPTAMSRVNGSFAQHYNKTHEHVGHVFQDRYLCKPIDDERYLLEVVRYIHNNPEEANVCAAKDYRWSSYHEYMGSPRLVDTHIVLDMLGGRSGFKRFCRERTDPMVRLSLAHCPSPEELTSIADAALAPITSSSVASLPREERNRCLVRLRDAGFSLKQIERLTGIGKGAIYYATQTCSE